VIAREDSSPVRVNLHLYIRNLVIEGHMSYHEVLDLTTYQIAALTTEKSLAPGLVDPKAFAKVMEGA
jgi:hypothetical protein